MSSVKAKVTVHVDGAPIRSNVLSLMEDFQKYLRTNLVGKLGITSVDVEVTEPGGMKHSVTVK